MDFLDLSPVNTVLQVGWTVMDRFAQYEAAHYETTINGIVTLTQYDGDDEEQQTIGTIQATLLHLEEAARRGHHWDVLDHSADYDPLFNVWHRWTSYDDELHNLLDTDPLDPHGHDLLLIERIRIDPEARGHDLSLAAIARTIRQFAPRGSLVVIEPHPTDCPAEPHTRDTDHSTTCDYCAKGIEGLARHYAKLNFVTTPEGNIMARTRHLDEQSDDNLTDWLNHYAAA